METVIYNGNVYEIGKFYLFSNDDKYFEFNSLHTINDPVKKYPFITDSNGAFKRIKEIPTGMCGMAGIHVATAKTSEK